MISWSHGSSSIRLPRDAREPSWGGQYCCHPARHFFCLILNISRTVCSKRPAHWILQQFLKQAMDCRLFPRPLVRSWLFFLFVRKCLPSLIQHPEWLLFYVFIPAFQHSLLAFLATVFKSIVAFVPERCGEVSNVNADQGKNRPCNSQTRRALYSGLVPNKA